MKYRLLLSFTLFILLSTKSFASTYIVSSPQDTGQATLRWAINQANTNNGLDTIQFNISIPTNGIIIIAPQTELPAITDPLFIDGFSQTGNIDTNIILFLSGSQLASNQNFGLFVNSGIFKIEGIHFKDFRNLPGPNWGYNRTAILLNPRTAYTSKVENIEINKNNFSSSLNAIRLSLDNYGIIDTLDGLQITNNNFNQIEMGFQLELSMFNSNIKSLNNWKLNNNSTENIRGTVFELDFKDVNTLIDSFYIEIKENDFTAFDTINYFYYGIELWLPRANGQDGQANLSIENNTLRKFARAIHIIGPKYHSTNPNYVSKIEINNNDISGNYCDHGIQISGSNNWNVFIDNNQIDSCKKAINIRENWSAGNNLFNNCRISQNNLSHNSFGLYVNNVEINNMEISRNTILNNTSGLSLYFSSHGATMFSIDSLSILDNDIAYNGGHGIEFSTGTHQLAMTNTSITNNDIWQNADDGIFFTIDGGTTYTRNITNFSISENRIYENGKNGIDFFGISHSNSNRYLNNLTISLNQIHHNIEKGILLSSVGVCGTPLKFNNTIIWNNTISHNHQEGIMIESIDWGSAPVTKYYSNVDIRKNVIFANWHKGILHHHESSKFKPAVPSINWVNNSSTVTASYSLNGKSNRTYIVEVFLSDSSMPNTEQGRQWIGTDTIRTNSQGHATGICQSVTASPYQFLTMNARDTYQGMTSEFSQYHSILAIEKTEELTFSIYPNPSTNYVYIQGNQNIKAVSLINNLGQMVKSIDYNQRKIKLSLQELPCGIYYLKINTQNGIFTKKIEKR